MRGAALRTRAVRVAASVALPAMVVGSSVAQQSAGTPTVLAAPAASSSDLLVNQSAPSSAPEVNRVGVLTVAASAIAGYQEPTYSWAPAPRPASAAAAIPAVPAVQTFGPLGIPSIAMAAYRAAADSLATSTPRCGIHWTLLAGIGQIESHHAGGRVDAKGTAITPVLGPVLDGTLAGNNVIRDTDGGALDGDGTHDRAVGPMQFLPGTWRLYASDGNGDGVTDPQNLFDASLAAAKYLCSGGLNLTTTEGVTAAVLRYNNSAAYVANVTAWAKAYDTGSYPTDLPPIAPPADPKPDVVTVAGTPEPGDKPASETSKPEETSSPEDAPPHEPPPHEPPPPPCFIFCPPPPA